MGIYRYIKLTAVAICLTFVLSVYSLTWTEKKANHKLNQLNDANTKKVAERLGTTNSDYFRQTLLAPFLRERVPDTDGNRAVQKHIIDQLKSFGWTVKEDTFTAQTPLGRKTFTNILAIQNPDATRRLTLACHHDSKYFANEEFIGATDSAVPCALLLDLAKVLSGYPPSSTGVSVQLLFLDGEEAFVQWTENDSLYGARHLATLMDNNIVQVEQDEFVTELQTMDAFILLDLIGTSDTRFSKMFSATGSLYDHMYNIEQRLVKAGVLDWKTQPLFTGMDLLYMERGGGIQDDHIPFLKKGVPILHLISYPFPSVWHKVTDNELALNYTTIDRMAKILRVFVVEYLHIPIQ